MYDHGRKLDVRFIWLLKFGVDDIRWDVVVKKRAQSQWWIANLNSLSLSRLRCFRCFLVSTIPLRPVLLLNRSVHRITKLFCCFVPISFTINDGIYPFYCQLFLFHTIRITKCAETCRKCQSWHSSTQTAICLAGRDLSFNSNLKDKTKPAFAKSTRRSRRAEANHSVATGGL